MINVEVLSYIKRKSSTFSRTDVIENVFASAKDICDTINKLRKDGVLEVIKPGFYKRTSYLEVQKIYEAVSVKIEKTETSTYQNLTSYILTLKENDVVCLNEIEQYKDSAWQLTTLIRTGNLEYIGNQKFRIRIELEKQDVLPLLKMGKILSERL